MRILLIEDEEKLLGILSRSLKGEGFAVDCASTVEEALHLAMWGTHDVIVMDLFLPDGSGTTVLRQIRNNRLDVPVLILTARTELNTKVENFEAGADDYLTKPFALTELILRVNALLRRGAVRKESVLRVADLELDRASRRVRRAGQRIDLSPKEYSLLEYLLDKRGRVVSRSMIIDQVWDQSFEGLTNIVDVYVRQLRRKVDEGYEPKLIHTVRGVGYSIDVESTT